MYINLITILVEHCGIQDYLDLHYFTRLTPKWSVRNGIHALGMAVLHPMESMQEASSNIYATFLWLIIQF